MKIILNWWGLYTQENLHLNSSSLSYLERKICKKFDSLNNLGLKLKVSTALYGLVENLSSTKR